MNSIKAKVPPSGTSSESSNTNKMMISKVHWGMQISCLIFTLGLFLSYLLYHLYRFNSPELCSTFEAVDQENCSSLLIEGHTSGKLICLSEPFDPWVKSFMLPIVGACVGQAFALYFRSFISLHGYSTEGKLRHPNATRLMIGIATIQATSILGFYLDIVPTTCVDFLGVKTHFFLWFEWLCTVPYMFFLVSIMDVKRQFMHEDDIFIEIIGGSSLVLLFACNFPFLPTILHWLNFTLANIMMTGALIWQQYNAHQEYNAAKAIFDNLMKKPHSLARPSPPPSPTNRPVTPTEQIEREAYDALCVAQCKLNASMFMSIWFTIIPAVYYVNYMQLIDSEVFIVTTYICSYLAKVLFTHIITDSHVEILDPNKFLIIEERRKAEESRLMFLRYVFHEVRVPLNSVVLGLQLLQDNREFARVEKETLTMMKDATSFMAETLNDVLSLQKIEQGMLELEYKPFSPKRLLSAVISNFRAPCEAKHIRVVTHCDKDIPKRLLGDQFRLEHVLGNLISNAVKFSDEDSLIEVFIAQENKLVSNVDHSHHDRLGKVVPTKALITFTVKDYACGMSAEDQKMLFQPFMQIRPGELQKGRGSGLGLSICKTIVNLHGGIIGCRSKQRSGLDRSTGGSEFFFSIAFDQAPNDCGASDLEGDDEDSLEFVHDEYSGEERLMNSNEGINGKNSCKDGEALSFDPITGKPLLKSLVVQVDEAYRNKRSKASSENTLITCGNISSKIDRPSRPQPCSPLYFHNKKTLVHGIASTTSVDDSDNDDDIRSVCSTLSKVSTKSIIADENYIAVVKVPTAIPLMKPQVIEPSSVPSTPSGRTTASRVDYAIGNILVCDDVLSNRKMLDMILKRKGLSCEQAADGSEAVALVKAKGLEYYDLIFMDSIMPILSGPQASEQLRTMGYSRLIIGVTGNAMDIDIREYEDAGADMILTKPVRMDILNKVLEFCRIQGCFSHFNYEGGMLSTRTIGSIASASPTHSNTKDYKQLPENRRLKNWIIKHQ